MAVEPLDYIHRWRLDETTGTTAADDLATKNGTYVNSPTLGVAGAPFGTGATLNGTNQSISVGNVLSSTNTATITGWIKRNGAQSASAGIFYGRGTRANGLGFFTDGLTLSYTWDSASNTYTWDSGLVIPNGRWVMVGLRVSATNERLYMYDQGVMSIASNNVGGHSATAIENAYIGEDDIGGRFFKGDADDWRVYNRSISDDEATEIGRVGLKIVNYKQVAGFFGAGF